jgi:hypothetical protein
MFITVLKTASHFSLSPTRPIQSMSTHHPISSRSISILASHPCLDLPNYLLPHVSPPNHNSTPTRIKSTAISPSTIQPTKQHSVTNTANAAPHTAVPLTQIYTSAPQFPHAPSVYLLLSTRQPHITPIYNHNIHKYCLYVLILLHLCTANHKILITIDFKLRPGRRWKMRCCGL